MTASFPKIPQADPGASYRVHRDRIDAAVHRVLDSGWFVLGAEGAGFEADFAAWLGAAEVVGCGNGTDALALILRGLGVGPGDAVATVSHTAVATVAAIEMVAATPVLVDIDPDFYTIDAADLAAVLARSPIRAVIAVHLYGQAADLGAIASLCAAHGAALIEDCSQAHGAIWNGRTVGTVGAAAAFSFYPTKNLGALGDAGAIATGDAELATRLRHLRQYGWASHYVSDAPGINSRLDEMQAAILRAKLPHLGAANARRQAIARAYDAALADRSGVIAPARRSGCDHVFHQYVLRVPDRDGFRDRLAADGIGTGIHYPMPVHLQPAYRDRLILGPARCAITEDVARKIVSLPIYPELTDAQVSRICAALRGAWA